MNLSKTHIFVDKAIRDCADETILRKRNVKVGSGKGLFLSDWRKIQREDLRHCAGEQCSASLKTRMKWLMERKPQDSEMSAMVFSG